MSSGLLYPPRKANLELELAKSLKTMLEESGREGFYIPP